MATSVNGDENAIPIQNRTSTAAEESPDLEFTIKQEGSRIFADTDVSCTFEVIPFFQGAFRNPTIVRTLTAGRTHIEVFLFPIEKYKVRMTPATQPNNFGCSVRTYNIT